MRSLQFKTQGQLAEAKKRTSLLQGAQEEARRQATAAHKSAEEAQAKSDEQVPIMQAYTLVAALTQDPSWHALLALRRTAPETNSRLCCGCCDLLGMQSALCPCIGTLLRESGLHVLAVTKVIYSAQYLKH